MSTFRPYVVTCPTCAHEFSVEVALGLHITRLPEIREQLKRGTFQIFTCEDCKTPVVVENALVYTDFERHEYVAVETHAGAGWQAAVARHETIYRNSFTSGPPIAQEWSQVFRRRLVFGFRALREKLVLWDAGLDDVIVEAVKGDLLAAADISTRDVVLRISRVLDHGHLLFSAHPAIVRKSDTPSNETVVGTMPAAHDFMTAPASMYAARASNQTKRRADYPWLASEWFVDIHDGPAYLYG